LEFWQKKPQTCTQCRSALLAATSHAGGRSGANCCARSALVSLDSATKELGKRGPHGCGSIDQLRGLKDFGSFSRDANSIEFSWNGGQGGSGGSLQRNIYINKIGDGAPVRLTFAPQDETHPAWSPDGRYIAFCRMIDNRTPFQRFGIYVVSAAG